MDARKHFSILGWAYVLFFIISNMVQVVLTFVWILVLKRSMDMGKLMLWSQIGMYLVGTPVFLLITKGLSTWKPKEKKNLGLGVLFLWIIFSFGLTYIGNLIGQGVMVVTNNITGMVQTNPVDEMMGELAPTIIFLSVVIIAPVMEEIMFRKLLVDRTVQYGQQVSVIVSGVAFGLFHGNFYQFFYASSLGMVFAYLYSTTGRIGYCIVLHMMINLLGGFIPILLMKGVEQSQTWAIIGSTILPMFMLVSILAVIVLFIKFRTRIFLFSGWVPVPEGGVWKSILLAPGVIGFFVISILAFVMLLIFS